MRRPVALLLGAAAVVATLAPQASANTYCTVGPARAFGPVCTAKCIATTTSFTCLWED